MFPRLLPRRTYMSYICLDMRDAWQMEHVLGKYIISDRPMTEEEWIRERGATVIDATPESEGGAGHQDRRGVR